jgi:hypothetical protein
MPDDRIEVVITTPADTAGLDKTSAGIRQVTAAQRESAAATGAETEAAKKVAPAVKEAGEAAKKAAEAKKDFKDAAEGAGKVLGPLGERLKMLVNPWQLAGAAIAGVVALIVSKYRELSNVESHAAAMDHLAKAAEALNTAMSNSQANLAGYKEGMRLLAQHTSGAADGLQKLIDQSQRQLSYQRRETEARRALELAEARATIKDPITLAQTEYDIHRKFNHEIAVMDRRQTQEAVDAKEKALRDIRGKEADYLKEMEAAEGRLVPFTIQRDRAQQRAADEAKKAAELNLDAIKAQDALLDARRGKAAPYLLARFTGAAEKAQGAADEQQRIADMAAKDAANKKARAAQLEAEAGEARKRHGDAVSTRSKWEAELPEDRARAEEDARRSQRLETLGSEAAYATHRAATSRLYEQSHERQLAENERREREKDATVRQAISTRDWSGIDRLAATNAPIQAVGRQIVAGLEKNSQVSLELLHAILRTVEKLNRENEQLKAYVYRGGIR